MRKIIYEGLSSKCLIISLTSLDSEPYNLEQSIRNYQAFLHKTLADRMTYGNLSEAYQDMLGAISPIHAGTRECVIDEQVVYLNSSIVSFKLPDRTSQEILNILTDRNCRNLQLPSTCSKMFFAKAMTGLGQYTSKMLYREDMYEAGQTEQFRYWFENRTNLDNKFIETPVLGFSTDSTGYTKFIALDRYYYGTLPQFNMKVCIYDDAAEAINEREGFWYNLSFISLPLRDFGPIRMAGKNKFNARIEGKTLIIADNVNGLASILDKLKEDTVAMSHNDIITVNQYSLVYTSNGTLIAESVHSGFNIDMYSFRMLALMLASKNRMHDICENRGNDRVMDVTFKYAKKTKNKFSVCQMRCYNDYRQNNFISFIVPFVPGQDLHLKALDVLRDYTNPENSNHGEIKRYYLDEILRDPAIQSDDILMTWFKKCASTAQSDEEKLKEAYQRLKDGLVKEYKGIEKYLAANDIGNKQPVPAVRVCNGLSRSPLNKISFYFEREMLHRINDYRLDEPVTTQSLNIRYMIPWKDCMGVKGRVNGKLPLESMLDKANNTIILDDIVVVKKHIEGMGRDLC
jgi:hypothetical protein